MARRPPASRGVHTVVAWLSTTVTSGPLRRITVGEPAPSSLMSLLAAVPASRALSVAARWPAATLDTHPHDGAGSGRGNREVWTQPLRWSPQDRTPHLPTWNDPRRRRPATDVRKRSGRPAAPSGTPPHIQEGGLGISSWQVPSAGECPRRGDGVQGACGVATRWRERHP